MPHPSYNLDEYDVDGLRKLRILLFNQQLAEKNRTAWHKLNHKLKEVQKELFKRTENPIYK